MNHPVTVTFWGTRGSIARPGPQTLKYGGNTSCVEVTLGKGTKVVIDCGSGAYDLGRSLLAGKEAPTRGSLLISHTHWDHIQGFPFFAPLFVPGGQWDIYGPTGLGRSLRDGLAGQMEHTYFPVTLDEMGASIRFHDLVEGCFDIDDIHITAGYLNHTALTLGYRLEMGGVIVVYACDHEPYARTPGEGGPLHELDRRHGEFLAGADLVIHDAQFTDAEYAQRIGWGHSPAEYVCELGRLGGVKQVALSHHEPARTDEQLDQIVTRLQDTLKSDGCSMKVFAAADKQSVVVCPSPGSPRLRTRGMAAGSAAAVLAVTDPLVLIGVADDDVARVLEEAATRAGVRSVRAADETSAVQLAVRFAPPLVILEDRPGVGIDGLGVCRRLRTESDRAMKAATVVLVADREKPDDGETAGVTQWLTTPFSGPYALAQLQAWLLRTSCRWVRAAVPPNEETRLAALREMSILDTRPEERFDRLTRLAAAVGDVPIALVSLVDRDRQWYKSCVGLSASETPRDVSFCAHALANRSPIVVADTLLDERFADNPLVVGGPRIRFYAGYPVFHTNGSCVGTLCLIDTRPRQLPATTARRLEDVAVLVQNELNAGLQPAGDSPPIS